MMSRYTKKISDLLIYLYFGLFFVSSVIPFFYSFYENISLMVEFIIMLIVFLLNFKLISKDHKAMMLLGTSMAFSIISIIFTKGGMGSFLNLMRFLMGIMIFSSIEPKINGLRRLKYVFGFIWIWYLVLSLTIWSAYENGTAFYNPNTIGCGLFFCSTALVHFMKNRNKNKFSIFVVMALSFVGILLTQCRSALIGEIIYAALLWIPLFKKIILKIKYLVPYANVALGLMFPILYINLHTAHVALMLAYSSKGLFTGREIVWAKALEALNTTQDGYLFGLGTRNVVSGGEYITNCHNWYLGVLYTFGIPTFLTYFLLVIKTFRKIKAYDVFCAFLALMVIGCFETVGLFGLMQPYFYVYFLLGRDDKVLEAKE